jgi:hypothetical protein
MFVSGLVQYQGLTDSLSTNARLRWEYQPGSELFVVYSDGRTTLSRGIPDRQNRSFVVKVTRLFNSDASRAIVPLALHLSMPRAKVYGMADTRQQRLCFG